MKNAPVLTDKDMHSALWKKLKAHLETRLDTTRRKNDGELDLVQTSRLRGRIAELKYLLDLDKPSPATHVDALE